LIFYQFPVESWAITWVRQIDPRHVGDDGFVFHNFSFRLIDLFFAFPGGVRLNFLLLLLSATWQAGLGQKNFARGVARFRQRLRREERGVLEISASSGGTGKPD